MKLAFLVEWRIFTIDATIVQELVALVHPSVAADMPIGTRRVAEYLQSSNVQVIGCDLTLAMLIGRANAIHQT